jgi:hypothetical protein
MSALRNVGEVGDGGEETIEAQRGASSLLFTGVRWASLGLTPGAEAGLLAGRTILFHHSCVVLEGHSTR